jgi:hypothetical protein
MALGPVARRPRMRARPRCARRAWRALCLGLALWGAPVQAAEILSARYDAPTTRYAHGVLGDRVEYGALVLRVAAADGTAAEVVVRLPEDHVFEDIAPRLADVDGDGAPEAVVVETDMALGAQLAVYDAAGRKIAATPHIGQRNRWLAPIGAADLDGDGLVELAYVDRPHLARTLRIWRYTGSGLVEVASKAGLTNHRIGEDFITSGLRDCGQGVELVTADAGWQRIIASRLQGGSITSRDIGPFEGAARLKRALACE